MFYWLLLRIWYGWLEFPSSGERPFLKGTSRLWSPPTPPISGSLSTTWMCPHPQKNKRYFVFSPIEVLFWRLFLQGHLQQASHWIVSVSLRACCHSGDARVLSRTLPSLILSPHIFLSKFGSNYLASQKTKKVLSLWHINLVTIQLLLDPELSIFRSLLSS